ncbi:MAG: N-acetylmuramoyl-L-alanine amidase [Cyclobacteriaceae bacterium]|nr:N-acetylmuramoyl-L-alanine amidase [Cyclobacteriaceae bacterium]
MRNIAGSFGFCLLLLLASFHPAGVTDYKVRKIIIDAGHGGKDPGTHGSLSREKDLALNIALELERIIKENMEDVEVRLTRRRDSFPTLNDRAEMANKYGADLFVSIHCNWVANPSIYGTETYVMGIHKTQDNFKVAQRENEVILMEENGKQDYDGFDPSSPESYILFSLAQNAYQQNSLMLAQNIEEEFKNRVGRKSRGVRSAGFLVLYKTYMPSVLVEVGYLSNPKEEKELNDKLNQVYIASGIYRAFRDYKKEMDSN